MARPKKTSPKRRQREGLSRSKRTAVVWIAPNLERITKGEQGRRGLNDPTSGYYLSLADLVLKEPSPTAKPGQRPSSADEALFAEPFPKPQIEEAQPAQAKQAKILLPRPPKGPSHPKLPKVEMPRQSAPEHPQLELPRLQPPKPPKFAPPKPPKSPRKPKPPRHRG